MQKQTRQTQQARQLKKAAIKMNAIMNAIRKIFGYRVLKTAVGAALAVFIARSLNLDFAVNAGIIVILSVQRTRKKSLELAVMRIGSTILALGIGALVFTFMGYTAVAFGVYLLLFIPFAVALKFNDGIVPCSVLVSHLLAANSVSLGMLGNEMMQMLIGAGIGFAINFFMPNLETTLEADMRSIDTLMGRILRNMAETLRMPGKAIDASLLTELETALRDGHTRALHHAENQISGGQTRFIQFMETRNRQFAILSFMQRYFGRLYQTCDQTHMAADVTETVARHFADQVVSGHVADPFTQHRDRFRAMELPATREEFENRATLYEYLNDLEHLFEVNPSVRPSISDSDTHSTIAPASARKAFQA